MFCVENCKCMTLDAAHCCFGYRESIFKHDLRGRVVITAVDIRLSRTPQPRLGYGDVEREVEARGARRCATSARPFVRSAGPSCPTLR